jgi:hypothetical protein
MKRQSERGAVLLLALMGLATMSILAGAFIERGFSDHRFTDRSQGNMEAFYLSESGIDQGLSWLRGQLVPPQWVDQRVLLGGWQGLGAGSYLVTVDPDDGNPASAIKRFTLDGWGVSGTVAAPLALRHNRMVVQTESYAQYAYFTNDERSWPNGLQVYFITGDRIEGPTHTNGQLSMFGQPVFEGPVSSTAATLNLWGGSAVTNPIFREPPKLGVPAKVYPTSFPSSIVTTARSGGLVLTGTSSVTLLANGKMQVTNSEKGWVNQEVALPANGVVYVEGGTLAVQGTLKGQLTLGCERDIRVVNSVTYADDPQRNPNSQDMLGIVAGGDVVIPREAPDNLRIDGSIMAINRSFGVEDWWVRPPKGRLTVYGGLIQANRGPVGSFNGNNGTKLSGYTKDYHYDPRLAGTNPPAFPMTGDYETLVWQEQ